MKKFSPEICPVCESGMWRPRSDGDYSFRYGRQTHKVGNQHYAICDRCGSRGFLPGQREENAAIIANYQHGLPGFISRSDVLAIREKYDLTQAQASAIFGGGKQGYSKWERGTATPAGPTARLMKLSIEFPEVMKKLAAEVGLEILIKHKQAEPKLRVVVLYQGSSEDLREDDEEIDCDYGDLPSSECRIDYADPDIALARGVQCH